MQIYRRTYMALLVLPGLVALFVVACSSPTPDPTPTVAPTSTADVEADTSAPAGESSSPDSATPDSPAESQPNADSPDDQSADTSSAEPGSSPTPAPEPEETPVSETESVGFYIRGFNSINRGEYIEAERTFTTVIELEPGFARGCRQDAAPA